MRVTKIIGFVSLVLIAAMSVQKAHAILPYSTYGDDNGWQGSTTYNEDGLDLIINFNVYDAWTYDEFDWDGEAPLLDDQYIYAYQILSTMSTEDIDYFSVLDIDGSLIPDSVINSTTTQPDELNLGISPDPCTSVVQGAWEWAQDNLLEAGGFSSWLIFSSPYAPVKGTFEVRIAEEDDDNGNPVPPGNIPEPTMVALLGAGAVMILRKGRRQDRRKYTARKNRTQGKC